jgi:hypothetical protein
MAAEVLVYAAAAVLALWGVAHLVPTGAVVRGFGEISPDNARILAMEWIAEGATHLFLAALVVLATALAGTAATGSHVVYRSAAAFLVVIAGLTAVTGARTPVVWFKACPFVLTAVSAALLVASLL